jgi:hypothetical protein
MKVSSINRAPLWRMFAGSIGSFRARLGGNCRYHGYGMQKAQMSRIAPRLKGAGFPPATVSTMWCLDQARALGRPLGFAANRRYSRRMSKSPRSRGWNQRRFTHFLLGFALVSAGAGSLASCASMAQLPVSAGGMPQDAPKRPQTAPAFPAVHDMPPPRKSAVLTEEEKKKVEAELAVVRAQQARRAQSSKSDPDW